MENAVYEKIERFKLLRSKGVIFRPHFHEQVEIAYCLKEAMSVVIENKEYWLEPGDLAMIYPNKHHGYSNTQMITPDKTLLLIFNPVDIDDYYYELTGMEPVCPVIRKERLPEFLPDLMENFWHVCKDTNDVRKLKAYTSVLVGNLLDCVEMRSLEEAKNIDMTMLVSSYLNANYNRPLTVSTVAKELGISATAISNMFMKELNTTFISYVNSLRVARAKKLLRSTAMSMKEIAAVSGFRSLRSFYRVFQDNCKITPNEYRKQDREKKIQKYGMGWDANK